MSLKEIKEAYEKERIIFGIKETLKHFKTDKKSKAKTFLVKNVRENTIKKLEDAKIKFEQTKTKEEVTKELNLDFESEVFLLNWDGERDKYASDEISESFWKSLSCYDN